MRQLSLVFASCIALIGCGDNIKPGGPGSPDARRQPDARAIDAPGDQQTTGIVEARAAADGDGLSLPIGYAVVTYVKTAGPSTSDPAGFTIQGGPTGPALFIGVNPATLTPPIAEGDIVSFTITEMDTNAGLRVALAITGLTQHSTGNSLDVFAQDVSAATDLVSAKDDYESEIVTVTGTLGAFASSGGGFQIAKLSTAGIPDDANLGLRVPVAVINAIDFAAGCAVTAVNVPFGRFNDQTQIGVYHASDVTLTGCPAPTVVGAIGLGLTTVRFNFSRNIAPASVNVNGSQFTFTGGVTATAAVVSGRSVTVTTSAQTLGTSYTATVAATITDLQGTALGAATDVTFTGSPAQAQLVINELNANITLSNCDLIELRVVAAGTTNGQRLTERIGGSGELSMVFPAATVAVNDLIIVHLNSGNATCNPGTSASETTGPTQFPTATYGRNYDTAYDFYDADGGLTGTDNVFTMYNALGEITDAVFTDTPGLPVPPGTDPVPNAAGNTLAAAQIVGAANQWMPAQLAYTAAQYEAAAVNSLSATGTTAAGTSIQRVTNTDTNAKADWTTGAGVAPTWAALNVGQTPLLRAR